MVVRGGERSVSSLCLAGAHHRPLASLASRSITLTITVVLRYASPSGLPQPPRPAEHRGSHAAAVHVDRIQSSNVPTLIGTAHTPSQAGCSRTTCAPVPVATGKQLALLLTRSQRYEQHANRPRAECTLPGRRRRSTPLPLAAAEAPGRTGLMTNCEDSSEPVPLTDPCRHQAAARRWSPGWASTRCRR